MLTGRFDFKAWALAGLMVFCSTSAVQAEEATSSPAGGVFATVGDRTVSMAEFAEALRLAIRSRYYHGQPPQSELATFQREVAEQLVDRMLLLQEAQRRGIRPDTAAVEKILDRYASRYAGDPRWEKQGSQIIKSLRLRLEQDSVLERLERSTRALPPPSDSELRAYYDAHPDKFTEPEQTHLSLILLRVDPSSGSTAWEGARREAKQLVQRLQEGADFAELARLHSADPTAAQGGDMGYVHKGMLGSEAQETIDVLHPGQVSKPLTLLDGIAIVRLEERKPPRLSDFFQVRERAAGLLGRERGDQAWKSLLTRLRAATRVTVNDKHLLPLTTNGSGSSQ